jgi:uncharacterized SAM-binding protein YcdF (DUF218 family)/glycosyltransferase involved in cell wall biosynthesis
MTKRSMLRGHDVVCFSSIDWQFIWQGHQEIMSALAASGTRVLFIENTGVRAPSIHDIPRLRQRLRNWGRGTKGFRQEGENLYIYSPLLLPFPYSAAARHINRMLLTRSLRRWMQAAGFKRPIVWTFLPTPLVREIMARLDPALSLYYCIDDFASSSPGARRITKHEQQMFLDVDLVFVTSEKLRQRASKFSRSVHLFPFGVSFKKFEQASEAPHEIPDDLAALKRPVIGYVGGVHRWIDFDMLAEVARRMPETSFALIGPLQADAAVIADLPNVYLFGKRAHEDIPLYIKGFDVGIVPYRASEYTANVYPTKLNEYLAMGIPVVATDLPEVRRFNSDHQDSVAVAPDTDRFIEALHDAIRPSTDSERHSRIQVARQNSWDKRISSMTTLIEKTLDAKRQRPEPWEAKFRRLYRRARGRVLVPLAAFILVYVLLFQTTLPWMLASPLRLDVAPEAADVIVVLAGGVGESGQAGGGYQERVAMAVKLYQSGFASRMVFESGYVFAFREAEIMRDLAISLDVPESAILLETTGANTYGQVTKVHAILRENGWQRILLVSSPYHMRRAMLTWRKQAPEVEVLPTPVPSSQFYVHERGASFEQLKGLAQEVAALAWYWWKGWI